MSTIFARIGSIAALLVGICTTFAPAATLATPVPNVVAQASPAPSPTPKPRFVFRGSIRAYDFTRQNASASKQDSADTQINQQSFNLSVAPHIDYNFNQNWTVGATYWYLNPLNGCSAPQAQLTPPCKVVVPKGQLPTGSELNPDDTLPGYQINALSEAYLQFQNSDLYFKGGNQILNTPWAGPNGGTIGSRIMPTSYQAADAIYKLSSNWQIEATDSWKFLPRTQSDFSSTTLITQVPLGYSQGFGGLASNIYNPSGMNITTPGFGFARVGYTSKNLTANFDYYDIYNITTLGWVDAKFTTPAGGSLHPYLLFQGGLENSSGTEVAGKIDSNVLGIAGGLNVMQNVVFQVSGDYVPTKSVSLILPKGFSCSSTTHTISAKGITQSLPYFLPNGGTPDCNTVNGVTTLTYGGWASPYSDGYATDPLFTTSLTQGMADRRSPGASYMLKLIGTSDDKRFVTYISYAGYDYNQAFMSAPTTEWDYDATYYFNKPASAGSYYKGFILRYRYGQRQQPFTNAALPLFKYNRFQAEYDF